jgi:hypothetical protein
MCDITYVTNQFAVIITLLIHTLQLSVRGDESSTTVETKIVATSGAVIGLGVDLRSANGAFLDIPSTLQPLVLFIDRRFLIVDGRRSLAIGRLVVVFVLLFHGIP